MPKSAYIHIPFCKQKCKYCSFVSYTCIDRITGYVYSLLKDINENYHAETLNTLYFGGGTPSLVTPDLLNKIIKKFKITNESEITMEINPDDADENYFKDVKTIGINRLSIGSQTFDNEILKYIGRRHNAEQIETTVNLAKNAGFENISLDLIYGLPNQTLKGLENDLKRFINLDIQHISTYGLKIEDNSFFGKNPPSNMPDDDEQADMYELLNSFLEQNKFYRYEISNFAKNGYESKHNLNYWNNDEYYGFGVSAHGYADGVRYYNYSNLDEYMKNPASHEYGKILTEQEKLEEEIFLGFRKSEGIDVNKIKQKFNINFESNYKDILTKYSDYFIKTDVGYTLNNKGILLSNIILAEFLN